MKWELDLWYELWDRAGSQGLDNWYDPRGEASDVPDTYQMTGRIRPRAGLKRGLDPPHWRRNPET